jgi:hypothetical protein
MTLLVLLAFSWLSLRMLLMLTQIARHTPEAQLGRDFQLELQQRGLLQQPPRTP